MADTRTSRIAELDARVKDLESRFRRLNARVAMADGILMDALQIAHSGGPNRSHLLSTIALALLALRDSHD